MARILVIEDDRNLRDLMRRILEGAGHQVVEAENGRVGMQLYRAQRPQVVITDLFMPEQDGIETIQELARQIPRPWIVAISGGGRHGIDMLEAAQELGASKVLRKPFHRRELLDATRF